MAAKSQEGPSAEAILAVLERVAPRPLALREIAERLGLERYDRRHMEEVLGEHTFAGRLRRLGRSRWQHVVRRQGPGEEPRSRALAQARIDRSAFDRTGGACPIGGGVIGKRE